MNIRQKCATVIAISMIASAALNVGILLIFIFPSFIDLERKQAVDNQKRVLSAIELQTLDLYKTSGDYAVWDATYDFAGGKGSPTYLEDNYYGSSIKNIDVDFVAIEDRAGNSLYGAIYQTEPTGVVASRPLSLAEIDSERALLATSDKGGRRGLLMTARGPLLVGASPVLRTGGEGPYAGTLVMGRYLDEIHLEELRETTRADFRLFDVADEGNLDPAESAALAKLLAGQEAITSYDDNGGLAAFDLLRDLGGRPVLLVRTTIDRAISNAGWHAVSAAIGGMLASGLIAMLATVVLLRRLVADPLSRLSQVLVEVGRSGDLSRRVANGRSDEIGLLARRFDLMLQELAKARAQLLEQSYGAGIAEMASGVLHNIRNQLAPISMRLGRIEDSISRPANAGISRAIEELRSSEADSARKQKILQFLELSLARIGNQQTGMVEEFRGITKDFLQIEQVLKDLDRFSHSTSTLVSIRLGDVVRESLSAIPKYSGFEPTYAIHPVIETVPPVVANRFVMKNILQNLLVNAVESMIAAGKRHGNISISAAETGEDGSPSVDLYVRDEGVGIAAENLDLLFVRNFSTKKGERRGTGLHWCANSMLAMGGRIVAESQGAGHGATLHLIIPRSEELNDAA